MIGVDTNVIVRLLVGDDARQAEAAARYLRRHCTESPALLSHIVLVEIAWVLEDVYGYKRAQIAAAIDGLLATAQLRSSDPPTVLAALGRFCSTAADFADCLLGMTNAAAGCDCTVTFDRKASRLPEFQLVPDR